MYTVELAQGQRSQGQPFAEANEDETAVHGCHCPGDMTVRMRKVLAIPRSFIELPFCFVCNSFFTHEKHYLTSLKVFGKKVLT